MNSVIAHCFGCLLYCILEVMYYLWFFPLYVGLAPMWVIRKLFLVVYKWCTCCNGAQKDNPNGENKDTFGGSVLRTIMVFIALIYVVGMNALYGIGIYEVIRYYMGHNFEFQSWEIGLYLFLFVQGCLIIISLGIVLFFLLREKIAITQIQFAKYIWTQYRYLIISIGKVLALDLDIEGLEGPLEEQLVIITTVSPSFFIGFICNWFFDDRITLICNGSKNCHVDFDHFNSCCTVEDVKYELSWIVSVLGAKLLTVFALFYVAYV
eukprot:UN24079